MKKTLAALLALTLAASASAATPNVNAVRPQGAQRGTEVDVQLFGARLADAKDLVFYRPGIAMTKLKIVSDGQIIVTLKLAQDSQLGLHDFRVRTATGISELRLFSVGALKDVAEVEPNSDFTKPQPVAMNITVNGVANTEDVDFYSVQAKKGERITAEVEGIRLGVTTFDPYVAIMNAKRFELASSDDAALVWQDGFASVIAPEDGTYIIQVRESAYAGNGSCLYRLHIGNFPRPTATIPAGGKPGETVEVRWIGDAAGEKTTSVKIPAEPERGFGLTAQDERGIAPQTNAFRVNGLINTLEVEPNDDHKTATPFTAPAALNGVIGKPGDVDHFVFKATKGQVYDIQVFARTLRSPLDSVMYLGARNAGAMLGSDDNGNPDSYFRFTAPNDGEYVIWLVDHLKKGGPDYFYRVEVSPVTAKLALSVPNEAVTRGTGTIAVAVPKGNRQAILVNANRANFGGDLKIGAEGLPTGVTLEADTMSGMVGTYPVVFSAAADAPQAGAMGKLTGKPTDPKVTVPCEFSQTVELVLGQNNIPVWTRTVDQLAVAVTDEAPYTIEIVEPKAPLVRGGSMGLKVVSKRKPGFTAPISVYLPWNPPGVGSAGGIAIPEKQNEAVIPMNADGGAPLTKWNIVVNGASGVASGPIQVSSPLAKLTIAPQYLTLGFQAASVEQGKEVDMAVKVNKAVDFAGEATVTLVGLPNKVTTDVKKITKDTPDLLFHLKTDKASPAGTDHNNLFCQVVVTVNGEPVLHNLGTGQLRIDVARSHPSQTPPPLPRSSLPAASPKPAPAAAPAKPLTRLEKLRQESKERAKAAAGTQ